MPSRRQYLAASSLALVGGVGCLGAASGGETTETVTEASGADTDGRIRITVSDGDGELDLATGDDVASVGDAEKSRRGGYRVPVTLTDEGTETFADGLERAGAFDDPASHEIRTYLDGERVNAATLGNDLAAEMESGEWDGRFVVHVADRAAAERLGDALADG